MLNPDICKSTRFCQFQSELSHQSVWVCCFPHLQLWVLLKETVKSFFIPSRAVKGVIAIVKEKFLTSENLPVSLGTWDKTVAWVVDKPDSDINIRWICCLLCPPTTPCSCSWSCGSSCAPLLHNSSPCRSGPPASQSSPQSYGLHSQIFCSQKFPSSPSPQVCMAAVPERNIRIQITLKYLKPTPL